MSRVGKQVARAVVERFVKGGGTPYGPGARALLGTRYHGGDPLREPYGRNPFATPTVDQVERVLGLPLEGERADA